MRFGHITPTELDWSAGHSAVTWFKWIILSVIFMIMQFGHLFSHRAGSLLIHIRTGYKIVF